MYARYSKEIVTRLKIAHLIPGLERVKIYLIVYFACSCTPQPISVHGNLMFWPIESHILSICVISIK